MARLGIVFISTVAVYGCEYGELITENHPLNGDTPYAKSKIMAEKYLIKWSKEQNVTLSILRPSLLAGKDAPGNLGAMVNGIKKGYYMNIAGGKVVKSILMAEDIANILPALVKKGGIYNVCDTRATFIRGIIKICGTSVRKAQADFYSILDGMVHG